MDGSRRDFLKSGLVALVGAVAAEAEAKPGARGEPAHALSAYPSRGVVKAAALRVNEPHRFYYPDKSSPCLMLRLGNAVPGGVGPAGDIVAFSEYCSHQGCPVDYDPARRVLKCPCHFSLFDPEKAGRMVCGQATQGLPRIVLRHDPKSDEIHAVAVEGLIYGRQANLL